MKIKCEFCGNMINDTQAVCPHCGAPNQRVRRASGDQPVTIEQLQKWYESKGLPPYEVTRFFIGVDYREPKAFGIYRDPNTGHYIVYKNKDTGARAIRYEGTDEAYAVNELFQRLKQEITQQKMANAEKKAGKNQQSAPSSGGCLTRLLKLMGWTVGGMVLILLLGFLLTVNDPDTGYYELGGTAYYRSSTDYNGSYWFRYDSEDELWSAPLSADALPEELETKKTAKAFFLGSHWNSDLVCSDFGQSVYAKDMEVGLSAKRGYYRSDGHIFYHLRMLHDEGWYQFKTEWEAVDFSDLPQALQHSSTAAEQFLSEEYSSDIEAEDFSQTLVYQDYFAPSTIRKGYYQADDLTLYHDDPYYDAGWYAYVDDEWAPISVDALPESLQHPSLVGDFYFTPTWNASTQFSDFEDSPYYEEDRDNWNGNDSDSDFDWDSGDSWDSGDTDWGSDW